MKAKPGPGKGNQSATIHGGAGAVRAIQKGEPFKGLAAKTEQEVKAEFYEAGRASMVEEQAVRLHTAARLYWNAVQKAADEGDLEKLDSYIARFGWLAGASLRAWEQVRKEEGNKPPSLDYDELIKELQNDGQED